MKHGVHIVGSVPMDNASQVFETVSAAVGPALDFMIGTECGFGRRDPATIPKLLDIHAEVAGIR